MTYFGIALVLLFLVQLYGIHMHFTSKKRTERLITAMYTLYFLQSEVLTNEINELKKQLKKYESKTGNKD